jgi:hypothetical protein
MTPYARALLIAMLGPLLQAAGAAWDLLEHGVFARGELEHITFEHIVSGPAHLLIAAGFVVACICIPLAIEIAVTGRRDVTEPDLEESTDAVAGLWYGSPPEVER